MSSLSVVRNPPETTADRMERLKAEMATIAAAERDEIVEDMRRLRARLSAAGGLSGLTPLMASEFAIIGNRLHVGLTAIENEGRRT